MRVRAFALLLSLCAALPARAATDWEDAVEAYNRGDYATAAKGFRPFAEYGKRVDAQYILGWIYQNGEGVKQDYAESAKWYRLAAQREHPDAQYALGTYYLFGNGVQRDEAEAAKWLHAAAKQGKAGAQYLYGYLLSRSESVQRNEAEGAQWYRKAAEQGLMEAQYAYGLALGTGAGVERNETESNVWLAKAAEQGHVDASYLLGWNYEKGVGTLPDYAQAAKWFQKAMDGGNAEALFHLASLIRDGRGVAKDDAKAIELFKKAAAQGQPATPGAIDDYIKAGRADAAFQIADTWLGRTPDDVQLLTLLAFTAINEARTEPVKYMAVARGYGDRAIALIEADKRPASMADADWAEYRTRWLPQLHQRLGAMAQKAGANDEARTRLERATALDAKDPYGWYLLGQTYFADYEKMSAAAKGLEGQAKGEAVGKAFAKLDDVIAAYARAIGLAEGRDDLKSMRDPLLKDLAGIYEFRNGTRKGLDEVLARYRPK